MSRLDDLYRARTRIAAEIHRLETIEAAGSAEGSGAILGACADLYGVTLEALLSDSREYRDVRARQAACWLLREHGLPYQSIGAIVGRDHSTVMHSCRRVDADPAVRALLWPLLGVAA